MKKYIYCFTICTRSGAGVCGPFRSKKIARDNKKCYEAAGLASGLIIRKKRYLMEV